MTVREMIKVLQGFDPGLPVARDAGEGEGSGVRIIEYLQVLTEATQAWGREEKEVVLIS